MTRKSPTTLDKLKIVLRYARCPKCGEKFGNLNEIQFDHIGQLSITDDNSLENFRPLHIECHKIKTAEDAAARAKTDRVKQDYIEFRKAILAKGERKPTAPKGKTWGKSLGGSRRLGRKRSSAPETD